jgi:hypothetical protein
VILETNRGGAELKTKIGSDKATSGIQVAKNKPKDPFNPKER